MTLPSIALALVCSLLIGSLFHVLVDGGPGRLLLYLLLSTIGFSAGQWIASAQHWSFIPVGPLQFGAAILGSVAALAVGHWLSKVSAQPADHGDTV